MAGFDPRRVQELLSYLLLHPGRPHHREQLAALLWDDVSTAQSKRYLSKTLWKVQVAFEAQGIDVKTHDLLVDGEWLQLNLTSLWVDVAFVEAAYAPVRGVRGRELSARQVQALEQAVAAYTDELLPGWYQEWCLFERERLQQIYQAILDKLMSYCEASGAYERGLVYGMEILRADRARERTHRRLMRLRYLARDRTGALRQYRQCAAALEEELAVKPAAETEQLYHLIRAGQEPLPQAAAGLPLPATAPQQRLLPLMQRLLALQETAINLQGKILSEIETLESNPR